MSRRVVGWTSLTFLVALAVTYPLLSSLYPRLGTIATVDEFIASHRGVRLQTLSLCYGLLFVLTLLQTAVFV